MPRQFMFTREDIIAAALALTREGGAGAVTARALGQRLGTSSKPVFGLFRNMEEVQQEVLIAADALYQRYLETDMAAGKYPPYKASGMAYIRFAREERELFKLLFMRDRSREKAPPEDGEDAPIIALIQKNTGMSRETARLFHLEMWIYVHGIATMTATAYLAFDEASVSGMLTDAYMSLKQRFLADGSALEAALTPQEDEE